VAQDCSFERLERLPRLDSQLVDQGVAGNAVDLERLGLPPRAVEREHPLRAESLLKRVSPGQRLELADQLRVPAEREIRLDALGERGHPELLQAVDLGTGKALVDELGQGEAAPERERRQQARGRGLRLVRRQRPPAGLQELGETVDVELARLDAKLVAAAAREE